MLTQTFISHRTLQDHLDDEDWAIIDCRFELTDTGAGERMYQEAHIPGAVFADLERDLSAQQTGTNGRHPLPTVDEHTALFSRLGIDSSVQVVGYDAQGGGFAARLWWALRFLGHGRVAVLDGGWPAWERTGLPARTGVETRAARVFRPEVQPWMRVEAENLRSSMHTGVIIDARAPERYQGLEEPLDPVAGHIPSALNRFWQSNLNADGTIQSPHVLRSAFNTLLGGGSAEEAVCYCGSGVTACHNILAAVHAGLEQPKLYAGSWSEWCSNPTNPVAKPEDRG